MGKVASTKGLFSVVCAAVLASAGSLSAPAQANSVWYEVDMLAGNASGTLNGVPFSNANVQLDFYGDTSTTKHFTVPNTPPTKGSTSGYINLTGSATFTIWNPNTFVKIGSGTFQSPAGIYVSVDNTNGGIGFGSFGVPPGHAGFPGQPVYPGAVLVPACCVSPNVTKYNLESNFFVSAYQIGCYGFPTCKTGRALATTAGPLVLNQITVGQGQFNAQVFLYSAVAPMNALNASVTVQPLAASTSSAAATSTDAVTAASTGAVQFHQFHVQGTFELGTGGETVDPATQDVVLRLGSQTFEIPAGSFAGSKEAGYFFDGKIGGVVLQATLTPQSAIGYSFQVAATGVPALPDTLAVGLTVGGAAGSTMVKAVRR